MEPKIRFFLPCSDFQSHSDGRGHDVIGLYDSLIVFDFPGRIQINVIFGLQLVSPNMDHFFRVETWMDHEYIGKWDDISIRSADYYAPVIVRITADDFYVPRPGVIRFDAHLNEILVDSHYLEIKDGRGDHDVRGDI